MTGKDILQDETVHSHAGGSAPAPPRWAHHLFFVLICNGVIKPKNYKNAAARLQPEAGISKNYCAINEFT
jgi:hypothetical protein